MTTSLALPPPPPIEALEENGPIALFVDFDGTLVNIASGPDAIEVSDDLGRRLGSLAERLEGALALVSGRGIDNLSRYLTGEGFFLAGSHGGHIVSSQGDMLRSADPLPDTVHQELSAFAKQHGLLHERKAHGAALHYRARPEAEAMACAFAGQIAVAHDLAIKNGSCVVELVRPGVNKGGAVEMLAVLAPFAGRTPIFIGDDFTDEDGFEACTDLGGFGILVGDRAPTAARFRLGTVGDVHAWLNL
ncbi:MAG: trehalose-phosphatase [Novosphingobium sp.]|nr:trehalose-phosphatase [Novosphingobium sp.]